MISNVLNLVDPKPPSAKRNINVITDIYHVNLDTSTLYIDQDQHTSEESEKAGSCCKLSSDLS